VVETLEEDIGSTIETGLTKRQPRINIAAHKMIGASLDGGVYMLDENLNLFRGIFIDIVPEAHP
jgi:hypothetical protein